MPPPPDATGAPAGGASDADEGFLRALLDQLAGPAPPEDARAALDGEGVLAALERLCAAGRSRTAIELLRRLLALPAALHRDPRRRPLLAARLAELLVERLEYDAAVPVLATLSGDPDHGARAEFLLGEAAERAGDAEGARRHYELVLAADIDYPKARGRHARLVPDGAGEPAGAQTIAGLEADRTTVGERYRLRSELGRGATSTVYLAHDVELDRDVALKLVHAQASARVQAEARMRSWGEARIAAALRHPGVVAVYDLDEERGLLVMELCAGGTLRERLVRGRLAPADAVRRARELLGTLAAVHEAGIVHRDLKPGNLLFRTPPALPGEEPSDDLVLADFGLALLGEAAGATRPAGTLDYLAPEARRGEPGTASDLYACGVILHEMLTGDRPGDRNQVLRGEALTAADLPAAVASALGAATAARLQSLLARLLAATPAERPTAAEAAALLDPLDAP